MIAIAVISIGLSGVAASLYYGHIQSQYAEEVATGAQYSRMLLEMATNRSLINNDLGADGLPLPTSGMNDTDAEPPRALSAPPFVERDFLGYWSTVEADNDDSARELARYKRKIQMERLGGSDTAEEYLVRVTVTIYWEDEKNAGKLRSTSTSAILPTTSAAP